MINLAELGRAFIVCGKTDMRRVIDSLAYIVKKRFNLDPFSGCVSLDASFSFAVAEEIASKHFIGTARDSGCFINALRTGSWPGRAMKTKLEGYPKTQDMICSILFGLA